MVPVRYTTLDLFGQGLGIIGLDAGLAHTLDPTGEEIVVALSSTASATRVVIAMTRLPLDFLSSVDFLQVYILIPYPNSSPLHV